MSEFIHGQLKVLVERTVRPLRTSLTIKRRMREELLAHLIDTYNEELARLNDEQAALARVKERFGDPAEVQIDLNGTINFGQRYLYLLEKGRREPGESWQHLLGKHLFGSVVFFAFMLVQLLPIRYVRHGEFDLLALQIFATLVPITAVFSFSLTYLADGFARSLSEDKQLQRGSLPWIVGSAVLFPAYVVFVHFALAGQLTPPEAMAFACLIVAPAAPVLFFLMARQTVDELRSEAEWAHVDLAE